MAVSFGSASVQTADSSVASRSVNVNTTGRRCGLITVVTYANAGVSLITGATIDGVAATLVAEAADTATEPGNVGAYFLDNITQGAAVAFAYTRTNNAVVTQMCVWAFNAAGACEVVGGVLLQEDGAYAEQNVTDSSPGTDSLRIASGYYGGASPAPVGANTTGIGTGADQTAFGWSNGRETTAGQGSRLVGFTQATSDDRAGVHFAIREVPAATAKAFPFQARVVRNPLLRR